MSLHNQRYVNWLLLSSCRWVLPFIGHMGICTSAGIIRDFAGSYFVSVSVAVFVCFLCFNLFIFKQQQAV